MTTYWKGFECVLEPKRVEAGTNTVIRILPHHLALEEVLMSTGSDHCVFAFILTSFRLFHQFLQMHNDKKNPNKIRKLRNLNIKGGFY